VVVAILTLKWKNLSQGLECKQYQLVSLPAFSVLQLWHRRATVVSTSLFLNSKICLFPIHPPAEYCKADGVDVYMLEALNPFTYLPYSLLGSLLLPTTWQGLLLYLCLPSLLGIPFLQSLIWKNTLRTACSHSVFNSI